MPKRGGWRFRRNKRRCNFCNPLPVSLQTIALLALANLFMTFAWYGQLMSLATAPKYTAALASGIIAFPSICYRCRPT